MFLIVPGMMAQALVSRANLRKSLRFISLTMYISPEVPCEKLMRRILRLYYSLDMRVNNILPTRIPNRDFCCTEVGFFPGDSTVIEALSPA